MEKTKELQRLTRQDGTTFHLIQQLEAHYTPFVVCWRYDGDGWDTGTYLKTYEEAVDAFNAKAIKFGFLDIRRHRKGSRLKIQRAGG